MKRAAYRPPRKRQWSTSTTLSTGRRRPACLYLLVDVDQPAFFSVDVDLPFSTCLFLMVDVDHVKSAGLLYIIVYLVDLPFSNWLMVDVRRRPFYSPFHHAP